MKTAFFKIGQTKIELSKLPLPKSTIAKFIESGEGIHHIAFCSKFQCRRSTSGARWTRASS